MQMIFIRDFSWNLQAAEDVETSVDIEHVNTHGSDSEIDESSQEVLPPPVKRKRRRKKRKIPKMDTDGVEVPSLSTEESAVPLVVNDAGEGKLDAEINVADVEEKAPQNALNSEGSFAGSVLKAEEKCSNEIAPSTSTVEEVNSAGPSCSGSINSDTKTDILEGSEKAATNDKDKHVKTSSEEVPTASTNPSPSSRHETPLHTAPSEVKNTPVIPRYSRFEFLANSMIITDVTTERGTVTVKECSAYEGFYGPEPDRPG